LRWCHFW